VEHGYAAYRMTHEKPETWNVESTFAKASVGKALNLECGTHTDFVLLHLFTIFET
jgi:hypothetical protein